MSWVKDLGTLFKEVLTVEKHVEDNAEDIKDLRKELKELTEFTYKVASAVKQYQTEMRGKHELLAANIQNELLLLENRRLRSGQVVLEEKSIDMDAITENT